MTRKEVQICVLQSSQLVINDFAGISLNPANRWNMALPLPGVPPSVSLEPAAPRSPACYRGQCNAIVSAYQQPNSNICNVIRRSSRSKDSCSSHNVLPRCGTPTILSRKVLQGESKIHVNSNTVHAHISFSTVYQANCLLHQCSTYYLSLIHISEPTRPY